MGTQAEKECEDCGELIRRKYIKKIREKYYCRNCASKRRKERREETLNNSGEKEEIIKLEKRIKKEYKEKYKDNNPPKIKGSIEKKKKTESYLSLYEKQALFRILIQRGIDREEAKQRIKDIVTEQARIRKDMKTENKTEEEIRNKQKEILEELWNY